MTGEAAQAPIALTPLSIGEIFDRAVTLFVRNIALFSLIVLALALPYGGIEYVADKSNAQSYRQIIQVIQHPESAKDNKQPAVMSPGESVGVFGAALVFALFAPFAAAATAVGVWSLYNGRTPDWRSCYAAVLPRAAHLFAAALCGACILFFTAFAGIVVIVIPVVIGAFAFAAAPAAGIALFVLSGLLFVALMLLVMVLVLCTALTVDGIGVEELSVGAAIGRGFGRIFNKRELGRATLVGLSVAAVNIGLSFVAFGVELLLVWLIRSQVADAVMQTLIALVQLAFISIVTAVYYLDVRIRQEGMDVYAALERLQTQAAT